MQNKRLHEKFPESSTGSGQIIDNNDHLMRVPRRDAGGGRETTLSFGVALHAFHGFY